ncbi:hypothetical protein LTR53_003120 [Teratosphaeriaceae sp. CCFEE 6253]|nr:hypothetical protein LTR53_003120 [Teratosphaeriaceae sp. CCFEE 6253]
MSQYKLSKQVVSTTAEIKRGPLLSLPKALQQAKELSRLLERREKHSKESLLHLSEEARGEEHERRLFLVDKRKQAYRVFLLGSLKYSYRSKNISLRDEFLRDLPSPEMIQQEAAASKRANAPVSATWRKGDTMPSIAIPVPPTAKINECATGLKRMHAAPSDGQIAPKRAKPNVLAPTSPRVVGTVVRKALPASKMGISRLQNRTPNQEEAAVQMAANKVPWGELIRRDQEKQAEHARLANIAKETATRRPAKRPAEAKVTGGVVGSEQAAVQTPQQAKKREADEVGYDLEETTAETSAKQPEAKPATEGTKKTVETEAADGTSTPVGLMNGRNACFSNAVIQMLAAALEGKDLESSLGALNSVGAFEHEVAQVVKCMSGRNTASRALTKAMGPLGDAVYKAAQSAQADGNSKAIIRQHLHQLLKQLQDRQSSNAAVPITFQLAFSIGVAVMDGESGTDGEEREKRRFWNGAEQQDSFEYYLRLMSILCNESTTADNHAMEALFEISTETTDVCSKNCDLSATYRVDTSTYHNITMPSGDEGEGASKTLQGRIDESMSSRLDSQCGMCIDGSIEKQTKVISAPERLVIKVCRTVAHGSQESFMTSKNTEKLQLPLSGKVRVDGHQYRLAAVVMHKGEEIHGGHYTVFRRSAGVWSHLNDGHVQHVKLESVRDGPIHGHSAMILLKKQQP